MHALLYSVLSASLLTYISIPNEYPPTLQSSITLITKHSRLSFLAVNLSLGHMYQLLFYHLRSLLMCSAAETQRPSFFTDDLGLDSPAGSTASVGHSILTARHKAPDKGWTWYCTGFCWSDNKTRLPTSDFTLGFHLGDESVR